MTLRRTFTVINQQIQITIFVFNKVMNPFPQLKIKIFINSV